MKMRLMRSFGTFAGTRGQHLERNIFADFSVLAAEYKAINLGQGFPSFETPEFVVQAAMESIAAGNNQYTRPGGHPELVQVLGDMYSKLLSRKINPTKEIVTFTGAQEGIFSIMVALLNEGDEVMVLEPYFDAYIRSASILGIKTVGIPLEFSPEKRQEFLARDKEAEISSADLHVDYEKLEAAITPKTKMFVLNTPHNPTGKVFRREELEQLCAILRRHPQITILSDEVYEFMTFDGLKHERIAAMPDMYDRVISLFSAGKTFSCTGWRIGYAICPEHYSSEILKIHNAIPFCGTTPFEVAMAKAFVVAQDNNYLEELPKMLQAKRDSMVQSLRDAHLIPIVPEGGYFVCCDTSHLQLFDDFRSINVNDPALTQSDRPDYQMALKLCRENQLTAIPTSPFYTKANKHLAGAVLRFAYCKDEATLDEAAAVISKLR